MTHDAAVNEAVSKLMNENCRWTDIAHAWRLAEHFRVSVRPTADGWIAASTKAVGTAFHPDGATAICLAVLRSKGVEISAVSAVPSAEQKPIALAKQEVGQKIQCATYACSNWVSAESVGPDQQPICPECWKATKNAIWILDVAN